MIINSSTNIKSKHHISLQVYPWSVQVECHNLFLCLTYECIRSQCCIVPVTTTTLRERRGSWVSNYLCNQCVSPLTLSVRIPLRRGVLDTTLCDKVCQWFAAGRRFSPGALVSSTNKTDCHDITDILLKVALNTITLTQNIYAIINI